MNAIMYKDKLNEFKGQRNSITKLLKEEKALNTKLTQDFLDSELGADILQLVGRQTQENLSFKIENLVTAAMEYVFDNPYQFKVEFDTKNNRTQCELFFERDGIKIDPMKDSSGGSLDVASIALRLALWSLQPNRTSPVLILDESTKHVSRDMREASSRFLKEMCNKLNMQMITVTHEAELIEGSDNIIKIVKNGKYSEVER